MVYAMTDGNPMKQVFKFSVPVIIGLLLQQLYNLADTAIVGHTLGALALGGVGSTGSVVFLIIGFCNGLCSGMALPVARTFGAEDYKRLRIYVTNSVWVGAAVSLLLLAIVLPGCRGILKLMSTPAEQFDYAYVYLFIVFCGIPASIMYNLSAGILRALGDSKTPLVFLMCAAVINIGLDLLLIIVFGMGVAGAAVATVSAQLFSGLLCVLYMKKHYSILAMEKGDWGARPAVIRELLANGVPFGLQYSITAIGSVMLQSAVNSLGAVYVSAQAIATKINMIVVSVYDGIGVGSANFTSQNLGAKKYKRIAEGSKACFNIGLVHWVITTAVILIFREKLTLLFISPEEAASIGRLVFLNSLCYIGLGPMLNIVSVLRPAIQGMGYSSFSMISGVMELIGRGAIGVIFIPMFGYIAACFASPLAWLLADIFLVWGYIRCYRKVSAEQ
ncbi:MAG: MATE family efflux transporter [Eubacteriales bacterium]|nr:MATE family efflux transporter [Eubacteriales bacterium]